MCGINRLERLGEDGGAHLPRNSITKHCQICGIFPPVSGAPVVSEGMNSTDLTEGAARIHDMGDLIDLQLRRARRAQAVRLEPVFYFDVTCPMSYLAAERVERSLGQIDWVAI